MRCSFFIISILVSSTIVVAQAGLIKSAAGWKAAVASVNITPNESMWMSGFGFRNKPSEGVTTDIWASALAVEDEKGQRAVFIAVDLSGTRKDFSDNLRGKLKAAYNLSKEQIVINSSHTHTGPATSESWGRDEVQKEKIRRYAAKLTDQLVEITGKAMNTLQPVKIYSGNGVTRFQVNRRNNIQYKLHLPEHFNGPNDYTVSVLKVEKVSGELLAVMFSYACHSSMLRDYKFSGDYPAYARMELEKLYPGATSLFFQGAGGNQIGHPRNTVVATKQAGKSLAAAVERVLSEPMKELSPSLTTTYEEISIRSDRTPPSKEELQAIISNTSSTESTIKNAKEELEKLNKGESLVQSYPYPVQVWKLGDLPIITLGGEPIVEYAIKLRLIFGQETFVFGYSNDVMTYISTPKVLNEGGYEGSFSPFSSYDAEGVRWALDIEPMIIQEVLKLAKQAGVQMAPKKFAIPGG